MFDVTGQQIDQAPWLLWKLQLPANPCTHILYCGLWRVYEILSWKACEDRSQEVVSFKVEAKNTIRCHMMLTEICIFFIESN